MGVWTSTLNSPWVWVAFRAGVEPVRRSFHQMRRIPGEDQAERGKQAAGSGCWGKGCLRPEDAGLLEVHLLHFCAI